MKPTWGQKADYNCRHAKTGHVLIELVVVIGLIAMMAGIAILSFGALWGNLRFKRQAEDLVSIFQMAYNGAAQTDRRYAVILDFVEQGYVLREFKSLDLLTMDPEEAILQSGYFTEALRLDYVTYDDLADTRDWDAEEVAEAQFSAGKSGWQYGGIIVIRDEEGKPWTIVIHRFAKPAELLEGEWDLESLGMLPQDKKNVPF